MFVLFINCAEHDYIRDIILGRKVFETRNRNMLKGITSIPDVVPLGCRSRRGLFVYLAETGHHGRPLIRCKAFIRPGIKITSRATWEALRPLTCVPVGSSYDWTDSTKCKWLYKLECIEPETHPFHPAEGPRHGRVYMETGV